MSFTGLTGFGLKYASTTGSERSSLLTRGPHALDDTVEHVSALLRHVWATLGFFGCFFQGIQLTVSSVSTPSVSFTERLSKIHLEIPWAYFSSCCIAFLKLAADEIGHKEVTRICVLRMEGYRKLGCISPNRTPITFFLPVSKPSCFQNF